MDNPPDDNPPVDTPRVQYGKLAQSYQCYHWIRANWRLEYVIRTEEYIPIEVLRHLLRVQGQINRLAAEQDIQIMDLESEVDRLRGDVALIQREINNPPVSGNHNDIVLACIVAGMAVLLSGFWVAGYHHGA